MGFSELKAAKEAFVTGHTGTSMHEVVLVTLIGPVREPQSFATWVAPWRLTCVARWLGRWCAHRPQVTVVLLRVVQAHWLQQVGA